MKKIYEHTFNETQKHPECKDGYVFSANYTRKRYDNLGWKDKYIGVQTYDIYGNKLTFDDTYPVFFSIKELESKGFKVVRK